MTHLVRGRPAQRPRHRRHRIFVALPELPFRCSARLCGTALTFSDAAPGPGSLTAAEFGKHVRLCEAPSPVASSSRQVRTSIKRLGPSRVRCTARADTRDSGVRRRPERHSTSCLTCERTSRVITKQHPGVLDLRRRSPRSARSSHVRVRRHLSSACTVAEGPGLGYGYDRSGAPAARELPLNTPSWTPLLLAACAVKSL